MLRTSFMTQIKIYPLCLLYVMSMVVVMVLVVVVAGVSSSSNSANDSNGNDNNHNFTFIIIRHAFDLDRPVSASSNSVFTSLPSRLRSFVL